MTEETENGASINIKIKDNIWIRSVLQGIPYIGPLIDNLVTGPGYKYQQERIERFMREVSEDLEILQGQHPIVEMLKSEDGYFIFMEVIDRVRRTKKKEKTKYYKNLFLSYMYWRSRDGTNNLDIFPEVFLRILDKYTVTHIEVVKELKQTFDFGATLKGSHLPYIYKQLNIPGGVFTYILFELYQDHLIALKFCNDIERYDLLSIEMVLDTFIFDEFYYAVVDSPINHLDIPSNLRV